MNNNINQMKTIPTYEVVVTEEGIDAIALTSHPAIEEMSILFSENKKKVYLSSDEKRTILSPILIPDKKVIRYDEEWGYYYLTMSDDTIRKIAINTLKRGGLSFNIEHTDATLPSLYASSLFIKENGVIRLPQQYDDLPDGTLFASIYVDDVELWNKLKRIYPFGLSIEGMFSVIPKQHIKDNNGDKDNIQKDKGNIDEGSNIVSVLQRIMDKYIQK